MGSFLVGSNSDSLGVLNGFRKLAEMYIAELVDEGKWFSVCHKIEDSQVDIMAIRNEKDVKLGSMINNMFEEGAYRTNIYKYLLANFMCYIEVPTISFKSDIGSRVNTFNKVLATSNTSVIASWLGVEEEDLDDKYTSRVYGIGFDDGESQLPYVKLTETKNGERKVVCPRTKIDVAERGTRVIPVFMLKAGVDALYSKLKSDIVKVSFMKDNGQIRNIFTTVNFNKIKDIYGTGSFYDNSVMDSYDGDFLANRFLNRGFIRVSEVGGSRYDDSTRSINYARIINIAYDEEPDLSFVNIDLSTVIESFENYVVENKKYAEDIITMLENFGLDGGLWGTKYERKDIISLLDWINVNKILFSTVFERDLCLFMLANPQWFSEFDGKPKSVSSISQDVGLC